MQQSRIPSALDTIKRDLSQSEKLKGNPFSKTYGTVAFVNQVTPASVAEAPRKRRLRLALVSLPKLAGETVEFSTVDSDLSHVDHAACMRNLVRCTDLAAREFLSQYECGLREAVRRGSDIVCVNELGFPFTDQGPCEEAIALTKELVNRHQCVVLAGSYHDRRTHYNTGHFYYPGCTGSGDHYHKQVSATGLGEYVSIPARRKVLVTKVFGLRIAVLICLDLADYSAVASVVGRGDAVDLLLVPGYSDRTELLESVAEAASHAMPGIVAFINRYGPPKASSLVYRFGKLQQTRSVEVQGGNGAICIYEFDRDVFQREKLNLQDAANERLQWLFDLRPVGLR